MPDSHSHIPLTRECLLNAERFGFSFLTQRFYVRMLLFAMDGDLFEPMVWLSDNVNKK